MSAFSEYPIVEHETEVLVLGAGAGGCGAALAAREAGARVLLVDKGKLESCGCIGGGNDHFMCVLNSDEPHDTIDDMVEFFSKPSSGLHPETVRAWGDAMPHIRDILAGLGVEFRRNPDGTYMRTPGFGQPGAWWILIRNGQYIKTFLAKHIRELGADVLEHVMITTLLTDNGRLAGAMGYHVLDGSFHVIRAKTAVLALGPRASRAYVNSTMNPYNTQYPPSTTGSHYVLAYNAGARIICLDTKQTATVLPKSFGCPGMNGITGSGSHALNSKLERFMFRHHPKGELAPRHLLVQNMFKEQRAGGGPPFYMDMRHLEPDVREVLEKELMPGDKATWTEYAEQKGVDFATTLMEVEVGDIMIEGFVQRDEHFESSLPGLFVGTGFHGFSGAICGGYAAGRNASEAARRCAAPPPVSLERARAEHARVLTPLFSRGQTSYALFEQAIRQVMNYYVGYVRNERGLKQALDSLKRIESLADDLHAANWHELMRAHEAQHLLQICKLLVLASLERRETSSKTLYLRSDYPDADPSLDGILALDRVGDEPRLSWI